MKRLILRSGLAMGDVVMLTGAVRDLHLCYPGYFRTDVRTPFPELWENNPYLKPLRSGEADVILDCHFPPINLTNHSPVHCLQGCIEFLNRRLGLEIELTEFKGDIHLSAAEKSWKSPLAELAGASLPFWIVVAGGKYDITIKWWEASRYQEVVDHFRNRIQFLQVGGGGHNHPKLEGVIDLRGKTDLRQIIRLVYHAQGVLCGVTGLMHLAAAVECKGKKNQGRPCVVIAGGREPAHREAYPGHQFIHTIGALSCCATGGCWKARTVPLGDGHKYDQKRHLCVDVRRNLPRCMDMITALDVIPRIETYFEADVRLYLSERQAQAAAKAVLATQGNLFDREFLTITNARALSEEYIETIPAYPDRFQGRGIVICGGGFQYFTNAWVCINMLRRLGCKLPIQLWHLGEQEMDERMRALVAPLGVECIDATEVRKMYPAAISGGWQLKPYAILYSRFREVLLLDADNVAVVNPEFLFETPQFRSTGAIFWPDYSRTAPRRYVWEFCGIPYRREPPFESGQVVVDKKKCWRALNLTLWYNEKSEFFFQHVHGDKETFHLAFRKLAKAFSMPETPVHTLRGTMCQHDFDGNRVFQHRNMLKWSLVAGNQGVRGFWLERECQTLLDQLCERWDGRMEYYREAMQFKSGLGAKGKSASRPARIVAVMTSCAERKKVRERTLRFLADTDWGARPVTVQMDPGRFEDRRDRISHTGYLALSKSLQTDAEYVLYLEDDLQFNRFIFHNLHAWEPLRNKEITLAGLYNPNLSPLAYDAKGHFFLASTRGALGAQAFLISRSTVKYLLDRWTDVETLVNLDLRLIHLASRLNRPIFYHTPSLVQHVGRKSVWGGFFHQAKDFDPLWKA